MVIEIEKANWRSGMTHEINLCISRQKSAQECRQLLVFLFAHEPEDEESTQESLLDELLNLAIVQGVRKKKAIV